MKIIASDQRKPVVQAKPGDDIELEEYLILINANPHFC